MELKKKKRAYKRKIKSIEGEVWLMIPNTNNRYMVSNMGRLKKYGVNKKGKFEEKLMKGTKTYSGKIQCMLRIDTEYTVTTYVHNLVIKTFLGIDMPFLIIHKDCNRENNALDNLQLVSKREYDQYNRDHCGFFVRKRRIFEWINSKGEIKISRCLFSPKDIRDIRRKYRSTRITQKQLALQYETTQSTISIICKGRVKGYHPQKFDIKKNLKRLPNRYHPSKNVETK